MSRARPARRPGVRRPRVPERAAGRERGIALITAILLVALGTIIAVEMGYQNAMTARRAEATYALDQSVLLAEGGEALAGYALRESLKGATQVYPGQPWSMPYGPVEVIPGVTLQAQLEDMSGRFNLNLLVGKNGQINQDAVTRFEQLLTLIGLEPKWADLIADWIDADQIPLPEGAEDSVYLSQSPPYRAANRYITSPSELLALPGFGRDRYLRIAPFVAALPYDGSSINLCSASGPVLDALGPPGQRQFSTMTAQDLAKQRADGCFPTKTEFDAGFGGDRGAQKASDLMVAETSNYFRLTSVITIGTTQFALYSLLVRQDPAHVRVFQRSFTAD